MGWSSPPTLLDTNLKLSSDTPKVKVELPTPTKQTQREPEPKLGQSLCTKTQPVRLNYNTKGGANLVELSEEPPVDEMTIGHMANQCAAHFAAHRMDCELEADLSEDAIECLPKLDTMSPHQFAQVFQAAKKKNPDILSCREAMVDQADIKAWLEAALKEIRQLESQGAWTECRKSEAEGQQTVPCTWVFRYKRNPAGDIIKCKARICMQGDLMTDDAESHAPVVQWSSI